MVKTNHWSWFHINVQAVVQCSTLQSQLGFLVFSWSCSWFITDFCPSLQRNRVIWFCFLARNSSWKSWEKTWQETGPRHEDGRKQICFLRFIHDIYTLKFLFNDYTKTYYSIVNYTVLVITCIIHLCFVYGLNVSALVKKKVIFQDTQ